MFRFMEGREGGGKVRIKGYCWGFDTNMLLAIIIWCLNFHIFSTSFHNYMGENDNNVVIE